MSQEVAENVAPFLLVKGTSCVETGLDLFSSVTEREVLGHIITLLFDHLKELILTYCQSFLLISYSLHNPPEQSLHSSSPADEITVGNKKQKRRT